MAGKEKARLLGGLDCYSIVHHLRNVPFLISSSIRLRRAIIHKFKFMLMIIVIAPRMYPVKKITTGVFQSIYIFFRPCEWLPYSLLYSANQNFRIVNRQFGGMVKFA